MIYKSFQDLRLSALGFGCMRLPTVGGDLNLVNEEEAAKMVARAMEAGVNYYDTAWGYHGGNSELVMGKILSAYPRNSFYLASKFPGYDLSNMDKVEEIFDKQLEKCRVDYFDFYLFHNICEMNIDAYLDPQYHIYESLMARKAAGQIKHLGFSAHGDYATMERFLTAYGKDMEFCQIQLNWLDWEFQNARDKVELLKQWNIPIWVMEPLRGGKLASLSQEDAARLNALRPGEKVPAWAFRFIQSLPEVTVTLSGMSTMEQVEDNLNTFQEEKPLSEEEQTALLTIAREMTGRTSVPCTACRYCTSHCPQGLDIPDLLELYNEFTFTGGGFIAPMRVGQLPPEKKPSACVGCRSCEAVCPQQIKISEAFTDFSQKLGL
ncbi:oxidoreductase [Pseudoflavonifractor sp. 60]|uniref:aldo/keto reductase n=1 Tax=Pseudoflavonifractor sp. 60 TaxID=2304576 RepID=UPI00136B7F2A|nr:aldo/keto reductase [Pseudoflavonifractor sp. 60]NBI65429.1 oxidoreductase [Pseudoflavonifractor sp. 60]